MKKFNLQKSIEKVKTIVDSAYTNDNVKTPEEVRLYKIFNRNLKKLKVKS